MKSSFRFDLLLYGMLFLASCSSLPEEYADENNPFVKEETSDYVLLYSGENQPSKSLLFVPGGLVDPHAYLCWMNLLVERNSELAVVLVKYPSNLALTKMKKVMDVAESIDGINHWVIGGHSLGGVVATTLVFEYPDFFDGLVLMASWSRESTSLAEWEGCVLSLYASEDMLATEVEIMENASYLPDGSDLDVLIGIEEIENHSYYYKIEGGNHAGFGCYGTQNGDGVASILVSEQQEEMLGVMSTYFNALW